MIDREITLVSRTKGTVVPLRGEEHTLVACTPSSPNSRPRAKRPFLKTSTPKLRNLIRIGRNTLGIFSKPYEPSLSICRSSLVLWKLISSRSCSSMVGGLARPDDELPARVAMPSPPRAFTPRFLLAFCRHDHLERETTASEARRGETRRGEARVSLESRPAERRGHVGTERNDRGQPRTGWDRHLASCC